MTPLAAYKSKSVLKISDQPSLNLEVLATADHTREDFSVANFGNHVIYITGGLVDGTPSASVLTFDISERESSFCSNSVPDMNESRCNHSSTVAGSKVWIFGGSN